MTETVNIKGMMCEHCEKTVKKALEALDGVETADVSHEKGTAVLSLTKEVPQESIKEAVNGKGYEFVSIQ